jgi:hypothetical protein
LRGGPRLSPGLRKFLRSVKASAIRVEIKQSIWGQALRREIGGVNHPPMIAGFTVAMLADLPAALLAVGAGGLA